MCHLIARQHDAVGGLFCVDNLGRDVESGEHGGADAGFDAVGAEENVDGVGR